MRHPTRAVFRTCLGLAAAITAIAVAAPAVSAAPPPPVSPSPAGAAPTAAGTTAASQPTPPVTPIAPDAQAAAAKAKATGAPAEIPSLTTETRRVLVKPDGTLRSESFAHPVRVNQNGAWSAIDATLVRRADGTLAPKATVGTAVFSGGGSGPAVSMTHGTQRLDLSWPAPLPTPVLNGASATYPNVLPGVDLKLTATADAYTEVLVVHDAQAASNPALKTLRLTMTGTNLTVRANADDSLSALDASGKEVYRSSPAIMWDSTIEPKVGDTPSDTDPGSGHITKVHLTATPAAAKSATGQSVDVALNVPDTALRGPGVNYPLVIDPWFSGQSMYWVSVSSKGYNTYNDSTSDARLGYCGWSGCNYDVLRSYFDMDVSGIAARNGVRANLTSAYFYITQDHDASCSSEPTDINESGWVDGNTQWPGPLQRQLDQEWSDAGGNSACPKSAGVVAFNVGSGIQDAVNYGWTTFTVGLHADNESDAYQWKRFWNNPHLDIDFNFPPSGPSADGEYVWGEFACNGVNYVNNPTNFLVNAWAQDNNPNPLNLKTWFEVWQAGGSRMSWNWNYAPVQTNSGTWAQWQTNYGTFPNGNYSFRATVENVPPSGDPAPPAWAFTGASGDSDANYSNSIANAPWHNFTVLSETMPSPSVKSYDFQKDLNGNPTWGAAQGTGGQFLLGNAWNSNTVGYSYAFDSGGAVNGVEASTCNYNSQYTSGGATYGLISDNGGSASLSLPAGLSVGHHTLYVKSFDAAHNMSPNATRYEFFISPNYNVSQTKFEAEDSKSVTIATSAPAGATAPTTSTQTWAGTSLWSGGAQVLFTGHEVGDKYMLTFNTSLDADYAIGLGLTKASDYGKLQIDVDGNILNGTDTTPFDGYAVPTTSGFFASGMRLAPGAHKVTLTVVGTNPATANSASKLQYQAGVDYIKAVPINNVSFASFSAAMNNHGISDDSAPAAANLDYNSRNPNGDPGSSTGSGFSLSKQALAAVGLGVGATFTLNGLNFTMPSANAGGNDNVVAMGQTITLDPSQRIPASAVGMLAVSTCGVTPQSTATVTYTASGPVADHPATTPVADWIGGPAQTAAYSPAYVNMPSGSGTNPARVYLLVLPANPGATLQSITLPNYGTTMVPGTCPTALHVLAVGVRPAASANVSTSADTAGAHPLTATGNVGFSPDHGSSAATGGSAVFDTTGGYLAASGPVLDTTKSFSVAAWAKVASGVTNAVVASQDGVNSSGFVLYVSTAGTWKFAMPIADVNGWNADQIETASPAVANTWTHLVATYDATAGTIALYVNGSLVATHAHTNAWAAGGPFVIGRDKYSGNNNAPFGGNISDVQVYQRALSATDVSTLASSAAPASVNTPTGPVGLWPLSDFGRAWLGAWASTPNTGAKASSGSIFSGQTIRQTVHASTFGSGTDTKLRVRFGNRFDTAPVTVNTATIALSGGSGSAAAKTIVPLTFGGATNRAVTIQPGAEVYSDPIAVSALGGTGDLTVSLYLANGATSAPESPQAAAVGFTAAGDQTADTAGASGTWTPLASGSKGWYFVSGVDVTSTDTTQGTVVVLGDQNSLSTSATVPSWVDDMPAALQTAGVASPGGFVNLSNTSVTAAGVANSLGQRMQDWWRLSDGSGSTGSDLLGKGSLTMSGTTWSTDHPATTTGSAAFNGTSAYGTASGPAIDTSASFTVSAWAKLSTLGAGNNEVLSVEGTTTSSFMVGYNGSNKTWWVFMPSADATNPAGTTITAAANAAQPTTWTHLTAVYDASAGSVKLYVNGTPAASATGVSAFKATGPLTIGRSLWNGTQTDYWPGNIADVETFQQALPAGDVALLANGGGADLQASNMLNASALDEPNPRTVVLALGTNDLLHGDTPAVIEANLQALATDIKTGLKQYKGPNGSSTVNVLLETVPSQGWASTDPREQARQALNNDLLAYKVSGVDGVEDTAKAASSAGTNATPSAVANAIATQFASDVASYLLAI